MEMTSIISGKKVKYRMAAFSSNSNPNIVCGYTVTAYYCDNSISTKFFIPTRKVACKKYLHDRTGLRIARRNANLKQRIPHVLNKFNTDVINAISSKAKGE
jgi:hypothetical protein